MSPARRWAPSVIGRVRKLERQLALAFVELGEGPEGVLNLRPDMARIGEGQALRVEIRAEARGEQGRAAAAAGRGRGRAARSSSRRRPSRPSWGH